VRVTNADDYRRAARDQWERSAPGWAARRAEIQRAAAGVSRWLVEAIAPQPGQTILELAAGPADTGLMAAELVRPGGKLICSDASEAMLEVARARARELGVEDAVELRQLDAEWIDLPAAGIDGVLCRWGYMLLADPEAALRETRRVLRPGGRVALAAWTAAAENGWASVPAELVRRRLGAPEPDPGAPGMFALGAPGRIEELLGDTGFTEPVVETLEVVFEHESFEDLWASRVELSVPFADAIGRLEPAQATELRAEMRASVEPFTDAAGRITLRGRTYVAAASA
jgi:ubiquinone/menaquinone biosynthesis C-methylase UbiE